MGDKLLHIFQKYHLRTVILKDTLNFKKHSPSCIGKPFSKSHNAECLTREACQKQVMRRNVTCRYLGDVP